MPASTVDPVNAALRNALSKNYSDNIMNAQLSGSARRILFTDIEFEPAESYQKSVLNNLKSKYIVLQSSKPPLVRKSDMGVDETLATPKHVLYPLENVQLGWSNSEWSVGAGMVNMGNTCYLNSTLQALFHVPALVNWLLSDKQHMVQCEDSGGGQVGCIICAMSKTLQASQQRNTNAIRPWLVFSKLRLVCRHLVPGRQEDAHEFLRYLVEAMERAYLQRFRHMSTLDSRSKETTPLNQILGGYLRSTVRCLECEHVSTTFQHFQDLLLDIRKVNTLDDALENYFAREKLDDMAYHCENCKKKVSAMKQFSLERAPMVLCIQLKRFSVTNNKITKHITFRQRLELTRYARRKPHVPLIYRLVALVTHMGATVSCGHYTAVAQASSGNFYQFDDSTVRHIPHQAVFNTNAYIMLYELECSESTVRSSVPYKNAFKSVNSTDTPQTAKDSASTTNTVISSAVHLNNSYMSSVLSGTSRNQNGSWQPPNISNGTAANHADSTSDSNDSESESVVPRSSLWKGGAPPENKNNMHLKNNVTIKNASSENLNSSQSEHKANSLAKTNGQSDKQNHSQDSFKSSLHKSQPQPENSAKQPLSSEEPNFKIGSSVSLTNSKKAEPETGVKRLAPVQSREFNGIKSSQTVTKLVPYEDDSSSSAEEGCVASKNLGQARALGQALGQSEQIVTKATVGTWKVSPTKNSFHGPSLEGQAGWNRRRESVSELLHLSHDGYAAPVTSWNGHRAQLNREIGNERREERKRAMTDNFDKGRIKHSKPNPSHMLSKSNPGYNPFQEYNHVRKWQNDSQYHKPYYGVRYRFNNKRMNYHNKQREKFRH